MKKIGFLVVSILCVGHLCAEPLLPGESAPIFVNPNIEGEYIFSADIVGSSWLLIDFFATDCEPCKEELPQLDDIYEEFSVKGLAGIVFAIDEGGRNTVKPYFVENPTELYVLIDRYKVTAENYGVKQIPSTFLVDMEGVIVFSHSGYSEEAIDEIREILLVELVGDDSN